MKRVIAFMIALAVCVGLIIPFGTATKTVAAGSLQITVSDVEIPLGKTLTVFFTGLAANLHNGADVYSIGIKELGNSSFKNISDANKQTVGANGEGSVDFTGLTLGNYTAVLRVWSKAQGTRTLQEMPVTVVKARPTISVKDETILLGDTLKVYIDDSAGNVHCGDAYSIAISGPTSNSTDISNGSSFYTSGDKFTYTGEYYDFTGWELKAGTYTVSLRYWNNAEGVVVLETKTFNVVKARPTISVKDETLKTGETLKVYVDDSAGNVHYGDVYSIAISGPTSGETNISNGSSFYTSGDKFTYTGEYYDFTGWELKAGTYTVSLRYWNNAEGVVVLETKTFNVVKARPTISVKDETLKTGETLKVYVDDSAGNVHYGDVYSIAISGPTSGETNISNGSSFGLSGDKFTYNGEYYDFTGFTLAEGTYTVALRYWNNGEGVVVLETKEFTVEQARPVISVESENLEFGDTLKVYVDASEGNVHNGDVYSVAISGPTSSFENISDGGKFTYTGETIDFSDLKAGTYTVALRYWHNGIDPTVIQTIIVTVEKAPQKTGYIKSNKTEYVEGELQYFSYQFDDASDANIGFRSIKIYNGSKLAFVWDWRDEARSNSASNEWLTETIANVAGTPGTYTMKVVILNTDTAYPGYEDMTYTYTVVERTEGTTPNAPEISVPKTTLLSGEQIAIAFDGMSIAALDNNTRYRIAVRNAQGTLLDSWVLWDCGNTYEGLYGMKYSQALPIGDYTVALETRPNSSGDYAAIDTIEILVKKASLTAQPELRESITIHYTVTLGSDITGTPVMKFVYNGQEKVVKGTSVGNNAYTFSLEGILPQDMGKTIDAYVSVDSAEVVRHQGYSMRAYCLSQMETTDDANLKALLVALLNYGAKAQNYFGSDESAVNEDVDQSILTNYLNGNYSASNPEGYVESPVDKESNKGEYVWKAAALGLYDTIKIRVKFEADSVKVKGLKVVVNESDVYTEFVEAGDNQWYVYIPVFAADFAQALRITFQNSDGDQVCGTLTYSVNTYVKYAKTSNKVTQDVKDLVESIYYYGALVAERA